MAFQFLIFVSKNVVVNGVNNMKKIILILSTFLISCSLFGCGLFSKGVEKYDTLSEKDEICNQKWADIDTNLQRRADLIPNLVETVKAAAGNENKILKEVMEARAKATQVTMVVKEGQNDFENEAKMREYLQAQNSLGTTLSRLMNVQEAYPELKSNQNFLNLQEQIEGTENRLLRSRQEYNKAVGDFNLELRRFSGKIINPLTNSEFKPRVYFKADAGSTAAPKVSFSN